MPWQPKTLGGRARRDPAVPSIPPPPGTAAGGCWPCSRGDGSLSPRATPPLPERLGVMGREGRDYFLRRKDTEGRCDRCACRRRGGAAAAAIFPAVGLRRAAWPSVPPRPLSASPGASRSLAGAGEGIPARECGGGGVRGALLPALASPRACGSRLRAGQGAGQAGALRP